uniref:Centrosomal protein of 85 kDa-like CC4 coiled-coil domain-containing protein n=1 Tax=Petromyzon marinus TaxID=7757 RepID=S4RQJ3_PETMA
TADLKRKLGAAELEVRTLRDSLLKVQNDHSAQLKKMEEKIKNRDKHMESLKKRCQKSTEERDEKERKLQSMDRYLSALPTMEDHQRNLQQMTELETLRSSLQHRVEALEGRLRDRDREILDRKTKEEELMATVQRYAPLGEREREDVRPSATEEERKSHNVRSSLLTKIINILKKKLEALTEEHGDKIRLLEEQVVHEEEENAALRDALGERDSGLQALQSAVKELAAQNQKLLDGHLSLKEELQETMDASRDHDRLSQVGSELQAQLSHCFGELRSLCRVVCQRVHGHDPNLSLLLGIQSECPEGSVRSGGGPVRVSVLDGVRQLRCELDEARAVLSERYAEDVGENCAVQ